MTGVDLGAAGISPSQPDSHDADDSSLYPLQGKLTALSGPDQQPARDALFGPVINLPARAPMLDRILGLTGRDPAWTAVQASDEP